MLSGATQSRYLRMDYSLREKNLVATPITENKNLENISEVKTQVTRMAENGTCLSGL